MQALRVNRLSGQDRQPELLIAPHCSLHCFFRVQPRRSVNLQSMHCMLNVLYTNDDGLCTYGCHFICTRWGVTRSVASESVQ